MIKNVFRNLKINILRKSLKLTCVRISLNQIKNGSSTQFLFGQNADLTSVVIDGNNNDCSEQREITSAIKIHDGRVIKSECTG